MRLEAHKHCHACGTVYVDMFADQPWPRGPRQCPSCGTVKYFNPTPIGVMLQQVVDGDRVGVATPIRGHNPMRGHPAITGGFHDGFDQSSQDAGGREILEEIRLPRVEGDDDAEIIHSQSTGPFIAERRQNLVFSVSPTVVPISAFDGFEPDAETLAMHYSWSPEVLAFPSHTAALARYFRRYHHMQVPEHFVRQPRTGQVIGDMPPVFEVPYAQPLLANGIWSVTLEDGGEPVGVEFTDGRWRRA